MRCLELLFAHEISALGMQVKVGAKRMRSAFGVLDNIMCRLVQHVSVQHCTTLLTDADGSPH